MNIEKIIEKIKRYLVKRGHPRCPFCGEELTHESGTRSCWFCENCEENG